MVPSDSSMNETASTDSPTAPMAPPPPPPAPMPVAASAPVPEPGSGLAPGEPMALPHAASGMTEPPASAPSANTQSFSTLPHMPSAPIAPSTASAPIAGAPADPTQQPQYVMIPAQPNPFVLGMKSVWESVKAMWKGGPVPAANVAQTNALHTWITSVILGISVAFVCVITVSMMVNGATNASLSFISQGLGGERVNENWVDGGAAVTSWFIILLAVFVLIAGRALIALAVMKIRGSQYGYRHALSIVTVALIPATVVAVVYILPSLFAGTLVGVMIFLPLLQFSIPCLFITTEIAIYVLTARACPNRSVYVPYTFMLPVWMLMGLLILFTTFLMLAS